MKVMVVGEMIEMTSMMGIRIVVLMVVEWGGVYKLYRIRD